MAFPYFFSISAIDLDLDAGVLGEALADLGQLLVGGRREVVPAEVADLTLLADGGCDAGGENAGEAGSRGQKTTASDTLHSGSSLESSADRCVQLATVDSGV